MSAFRFAGLEGQADVQGPQGGSDGAGVQPRQRRHICEHFC